MSSGTDSKDPGRPRALFPVGAQDHAAGDVGRVPPQDRSPAAPALASPAQILQFMEDAKKLLTVADWAQRVVDAQDLSGNKGETRRQFALRGLRKSLKVLKS